MKIITRTGWGDSSSGMLHYMYGVGGYRNEAWSVINSRLDRTTFSKWRFGRNWSIQNNQVRSFRRYL